MKSLQRISIVTVLLIVAACGGKPEQEEAAPKSDDPYAGDPRLGRLYVVDIEKDQPPAIRLSIQLRKGGGARLVFQHGNARAFREERGKWHRDGKKVFVDLDPTASERNDTSLPIGGSVFQQAELPSRLEFDIGPNAIATRIPSLSETYLQFEKVKRGDD